MSASQSKGITLSGDVRYGLAYSEGIKFLNEHEPDPILLGLVQKICNNSSSILEIGCGEGFEAAALARLGYSVEAIDASPEAISRAIECNPATSSIFTVAAWPDYGSHRTIPYELIIDIGCLHSLTDPRVRTKYLDAIRVALKPTGHYYVRIGSGEYKQHLPRDKCFDVWWEREDGQTVILPAPPKGWRPTRKDVLGEFQDRSFSVDWCIKTHGQTYPEEFVILSSPTSTSKTNGIISSLSE